VQAAVHPRSVVDRISHVFEVFKDDYWVRELRHPFDYLTRYFVQAIVNVVPLLSLHDGFKRFLACFLYPLPLREETVALFLDFRVFDHHRV
jgi:hypothetical protein